MWAWIVANAVGLFIGWFILGAASACFACLWFGDRNDKHDIEKGIAFGALFPITVPTLLLVVVSRGIYFLLADLPRPKLPSFRKKRKSWDELEAMAKEVIAALDDINKAQKYPTKEEIRPQAPKLKPGYGLEDAMRRQREYHSLSEKERLSKPFTYV